MRILITGATGFIGSKITACCHRHNIAVNYLTRSRSKIESRDDYRGFLWDPAKKEIDPACLENVDAIINLAGAGLFKRWTASYKKKIIKSRIDSLSLLFETLQNNNHHQVKQLVSASATGIYPSSLQKIYTEEDTETNHSFLTHVVKKWEQAADRFSGIGIDVAKIRIGIVLGKNGGALPQLIWPIKNYIGTPLGSGHQWQSWIHLEDVARVFLFAIGNNLDGAYNAVAPNPVMQKELIVAIAAKLQKPLLFSKMPAFILKLVLGEMSAMVLSSQLVENKKIEQMGFHFHYTHITKALDDLL